MPKSNREIALEQIQEVNKAVEDLDAEDRDQVIRLAAGIRMTIEICGIKDYPLQVLAMTKATQDLIMEKADLENDQW